MTTEQALPNKLMFRRVVSDQFTVDLRSDTVGIFFIGEFAIRWTPLVSSKVQTNPRSVARHTVQQAAERVSGEFPVTDLAAAEQAVNAKLGRLGAGADGDVRIETASLQLSVSSETERLVFEQNQRLRQANLECQIQRREIERLESFRSTVLADPASAMSYWFMHHPDQLDDSVYTQIENLVERIADNDPQMRWIRVAKLLTEFIDGLTAKDKSALINLLSHQLRTFGHSKYAQEVEEILDHSDLAY